MPAPVDYDGATSALHRVHVWGNYSDQIPKYGHVDGWLIELQDRLGGELKLRAR